MRLVLSEQPRSRLVTRGVGSTLAAVLFSLTTGALWAQAPQPSPGAKPAEPTADPPPKVLVPVAFSTINRNPDRFYGELVSLTATVERRLSTFAFSIDHDLSRSTGQEVLVLARRMSDPITLNTYVTVVGEFVRFDPIETPSLAKDFTIDLPPDLVAAWAGRPTVLATAVVNDQSVDLARFIPPPKSPEETEYAKLMRGVGAANAELRKGVQGSTAELVTKDTALLKQAFLDVEAFWRTRDKADASGWAADARLVVESMEKAMAAEPDWAAAKTSLNTLGKACTTCHGAYRERLEDGSFRVKPDDR